jgi:GH24 family phage-related lysozyme (muramidase)
MDLDLVRSRLVAQLAIEESYSRAAYQDENGYWTIGYGRLIDSRRGGGISNAEATTLLQNDVGALLTALQAYYWWNSQDEVRAVAAADMAFNLGFPAGLLHFPKFLLALGAHDYPGAVAELVGTPWESQVKSRATRIEAMLISGQWPQLPTGS